MKAKLTNGIFCFNDGHNFTPEVKNKESKIDTNVATIVFLLIFPIFVYFI